MQVNRQLVAISAGSSAVSLIVGSVLGYFFAKNKLEIQYERFIEDEVEFTRKYYKQQAEKEIAKVREHFNLNVQRNKPPTVIVPPETFHPDAETEERFREALAPYQPDGEVQEEGDTPEPNHEEKWSEEEYQPPQQDKTEEAFEQMEKNGGIALMGADPSSLEVEELKHGVDEEKVEEVKHGVDGAWMTNEVVDISTEEPAGVTDIIEVPDNLREKPDIFGSTLRDFPGYRDPVSVPQAREETPVDGNFRPAYVISTEDFRQNPDDHAQTTLTYYKEDDTLVDDSDMVIEDRNMYVGDALRHFGQMSDSPFTVYVRNTYLRMDFEVVQNDGAYGVIVAGFEPPREPKPRRPRRPRGGDHE